MNGLVSLSALENDIQSLAQKVYTGKELDRVNTFYKEHCEIVERELYVLQILKEKYVNLVAIKRYVFCVGEKLSIEEWLEKYNIIMEDKLTMGEFKLIVEWLKGE